MTVAPGPMKMGPLSAIRMAPGWMTAPSPMHTFSPRSMIALGLTVPRTSPGEAKRRKSAAISRALAATRSHGHRMTGTSTSRPGRPANAAASTVSLSMAAAALAPSARRTATTAPPARKTSSGPSSGTRAARSSPARMRPFTSSVGPARCARASSAVATTLRLPSSRTAAAR